MTTGSLPQRLPLDVMNEVVAYLLQPEDDESAWNEQYWSHGLPTIDDDEEEPVESDNTPSQTYFLEPVFQLATQGEGIPSRDVIFEDEAVSESDDDEARSQCATTVEVPEGFHLRRHNDLHACSLVASEWHAAARSHIFRDLECVLVNNAADEGDIATSADSQADPSHNSATLHFDVVPLNRPHKTFSMFLELLVSNPGIACSIRRLRLEAISPGAIRDENAYKVPLPTLFSILRLCPRLEHLWLKNIFPVLPDVPEGIQALTAVKTLRITSTLDAVSLGEDQVEALLLFFSDVGRLYIDVPNFRGRETSSAGGETVLWSGTSSLRLHTWNSLRFPSMQRVLMHIPTTCTLTTLQVNCIAGDDCLEFQRFLNAVGPTLKDLCVGFVGKQVGDESALSDHGEYHSVHSCGQGYITNILPLAKVNLSNCTALTSLTVYAISHRHPNHQTLFDRLRCRSAWDECFQLLATISASNRNLETVLLDLCRSVWPTDSDVGRMNSSFSTIKRTFTTLKTVKFKTFTIKNTYDSKLYLFPAWLMHGMENGILETGVCYNASCRFF